MARRSPLAEIGCNNCGIRNRLMRASFRDDLAVTQHHDSIADRGDHIHVVLDNQDRNVPLLAGVQDETCDVFLFLVIHAGHRLVEDEEPRLSGERASQLHAFL